MCQKGYGWMIRNTCADEGMDIKKYMLCLLSRLPALLGAVIGGALLGAVIYTIVRTVPESEREYQAYARYSLTLRRMRRARFIRHITVTLGMT